MKKNKSMFASYLVRILLLLVVIVGGYLAFDRLTSPPPPSLPDQPDPLTHSKEIPPATGFFFQNEPVIETIWRWHTDEQQGLTVINQRLADDFEVLVLDEDINANGSSNYLIIHRDENLPALSTSLSDVGYTYIFRDLAVYEVHDRTLLPLLTIDHHAIRNEIGDQLIDQVAALNGYALLLETYEHEVLYDKPVRLIEIVMIDDAGREISDEIIIYWDPSESTFKATNTFGAP